MPLDQEPKPEVLYSACPHDCPSTCALEVERISPTRVGRLRGAKDNSYTAGVICAKVARYAERVHHPDRLLHPLRRIGDKGGGSEAFERISWDDALDEVAERMLAAEAKDGPEAVWPHYYAGTMGLVQRDGINRLRHAKRYSGMHATICVTLAWTGFTAGAGALRGVDPREMAVSDLVIIWGTNAVNTQVNVMTHAVKAQRSRGAKIVVIDTYRNSTAERADMFLCVKPGTDGALACAVMHVLFRDGHADWDYLEQYTDAPREFEAHLKTRTPEWAAAITGLSAGEIESFARLIGTTKRAFFRLGYGFARNRNGSVNMHAASCIPAVTGAWRHEGGGAFHNSGAIYGWDRSMIEGLDLRDPEIRVLDQSRIGAVLTGDPDALKGGPPVTALFIQNTNPMMVSPDLNKVHAGFARDDLFTCVHEQFLTETARMADIVLPATMFLEHDDVYQGGGHQHIILGPKIIDPPDECRSNHEVIRALAKRLGAEHPGFQMTPLQLIDHLLKASGRGNLEQLKQQRWIDCQPDFETSHYLNGFAHEDGKFRFRPDWGACAPHGFGAAEGPAAMPRFPDHWPVIEAASAEHPFKLVTAPARNYLNSSFTETATSREKEGRPTAKIHPEDARELGIGDGGRARLGNRRGTVLLHAEVFDGLRRGVVIVESVWPNAAFEEGIGINALTGADPCSPIGGSAFHDTAIWVRPG